MEKTAPAPRLRTQRLQHRISSSNDIEKEVLKHRNKTVTTPLFGRVAQRLFENIMVSRWSIDQDVESDDTPHHLSIIHPANPNSVRWLDPVHGHPGFYESVFLDGAKYSVSSLLISTNVSYLRQVRDAVMVVPGEDEDAVRAKCYKHQPSQSITRLANDYW